MGGVVRWVYWVTYPSMGLYRGVRRKQHSRFSLRSNNIRRKPLWRKDLGRIGRGIDVLTPLIATTYNYFYKIIFRVVFGVDLCR